MAGSRNDAGSRGPTPSRMDAGGAAGASAQKGIQLSVNEGQASNELDAPLSTTELPMGSLNQMSTLRSSGQMGSGRASKRNALPAKECLRQTAANVLMQLAIDDDNKQAVREAGGIKKLVSLLTSPDPEVQLNVLGALTNLALNDENKAEIRELQAIPKIVELVDSPEEIVQEKVVEVIWNLAGNDENRVSVLLAGGVDKLLDLLPTGKYAETGQTERRLRITSSALGALANLAVHPENHTAIRDRLGIKKVIDLLVNAEHHRTKERAANCLENLALDRENREMMRSLGSSAALSRLLISGNDDWVRAAAGALKNLSVDEESKSEIFKQDGLKSLVDLLHHSDMVIVGKCAECLGNFANEQKYRAEIRMLDGIRQLLNLLKPGTPDQGRLAAAGAVLNLAVEDECKFVIREQDGISKLIPLLGATLPLTLRSVAAMTVTNLAAQEDCALGIADCGGVNALIQCMGTPTDDVLQEKAASALWNLAAVEPIKAKIRKAGGIPFLLRVFEFSSFVPAIENCLGTLLSLAETQENRFAIADSGAMNLLITLMGSEHPAVVEKAAGVIWNLSHEETVQHSVRQLGGLKPLIKLLSSDSPLIRFNAVGAFPLLTEQEENVFECYELGIINPLANLLATETNVLVLQNSAQTLGNMAESNALHQQAISEANGLQRLVDVIYKWAPRGQKDPRDAGSPNSWENCQELLAKCCFGAWLICQKNEANQLIFSEAGGMAGLVLLLMPSNADTLLEMAAGAVCSLCDGCDANKTRFRDEDGLTPLIALLEHTSDSVKLNAAKALCHLAENQDNRAIIRELGGLEKLVSLLSH